MPDSPLRRILTLGPLPPEKCAYALARYSRSPDSIAESLNWVRSHDSTRFFEHFYFQYNHSSIADLGHLVLCFENISELAAIEIEDEPLWDGQAKSSRYQDFSHCGFVTPPEFEQPAVARYAEAARSLLEAYSRIHEAAAELLAERLPRPADMDPEAYRRNIRARAFDVARYLLFLGIPTNIGQITSIRTLEKQIRRLRASEYLELQNIGEEMAAACARPPELVWMAEQAGEPVAPTLARWADADLYLAGARAELRAWARQNLPPAGGLDVERVELIRPDDRAADIVATLLYPVTNRPFRELYELARGWSEAMRREVLEIASRSRTERDELLRSFRSAPFAFDIIMDIGAYRDLHRHRRCHQFRQAFSTELGYETPRLVAEAGLTSVYADAINRALAVAAELPAPGAHYLLPFAVRGRFLFKMDLAEVEYICRVRTGVKGHFSYRDIAWRMKCKMEEAVPELGRLITATPPWVEDPLKR